MYLYIVIPFNAIISFHGKKDGTILRMSSYGNLSEEDCKTIIESIVQADYPREFTHNFGLDWEKPLLMWCMEVLPSSAIYDNKLYTDVAAPFRTIFKHVTFFHSYHSRRLLYYSLMLARSAPFSTAFHVSFMSAKAGYNHARQSGNVTMR